MAAKPVRAANWVDPLRYVEVDDDQDVMLVTALRDLYLSIFYAEGAAKLFTDDVLPRAVVLAYANAGSVLSRAGLHPQRVGEGGA